jgi:MFS family permease
LPYYFERERHYPKKDLALVASLPFWGVAVSALICGLLADAIIRRGFEPGRVRQSFLCVGLLGCCVFLFPAVMVKSEFSANALLMTAAVCMGAWSSNHWALTQRLAGAPAAGKWTAFQNCLGNCAGWVGAIITGHVLQATNSFFLAFAIACAVLILGVCGYWIVIGRPDQVSWISYLPQQTNSSYS